ncbi:MAG TPA: cadherin-like domain-containing protein, partial [Chitinophagales bacterium]|nr:cadherin-like domain-containing protein [Chitinophagales bacterium]
EDVDPDPEVTRYEWVPKGDTTVPLPDKNDVSIKGTDTASTSNWRWNIEDIDCENATITFEAWDDCGETVDSEEVLIDNVAPWIELTAPDAECDVDCVDLEWKIIQEKCLTCGVGCTDWWVGTIEVSQGTLDNKPSKKITVACDCTLPATGTVKWCFGDVDCGTTLIATLTVWDAAGNMAVEVVELKDVDNMAPRIDHFTVNPTLKFDNEDPYLEMSWSATDNCPNSVSVWVDQGYLERRYPDSDNAILAQIEPFEPEDWEDKWTGGPNSFTVDASGMRWYLDDPAASGTVWIAFQDVCCNEAVASSSLGLKFNMNVDWEGEGWAGDGGTGFLYGTVVKLEAEPDQCWYFEKWQITDRKGSYSSRDYPLRYTITGDASITAIFVAHVVDLVAVDDFGATDQDTALTVDATNGVLENDYDPDGDDLIVTETTNGTDTADAGDPIAGTNGGTFTINPDGSYTFDPGEDFVYLPKDATTTTSVVYTARDVLCESGEATLTITVTGLNDSPVFTHGPEETVGSVT